MVTRRTLIAALLSAPLLATVPWPVSAEDAPLKVVASFSILGDMAKEIGGTHIEVKTLVGPDGDAHVYEPSPADAKALGEAKLLIANGLNFEPWLPRLVKSSGFKGIEVLASEGVAPREFSMAADSADHHDHDETSHDHDHGSNDPHAWQDLANGVIYVKNIAAALAKADPDHADLYRSNASRYMAELETLNAKLKAQFAAIPEADRKVVTSHDAFGYFGKAYGITFLAPAGMSTEAEASAADIARIIDQIRSDHIKAVFVENITNTRLIDQITRETGARVGGALFSDALSAADGPAPTYVKMFEYNAAELIKALAGS
ncbi:metal ABC transporter substrate-binding protein [Rhodoligotrophos ferricapiens]|uniref:metal ABC transporter substrate-binding protein n=1 Tax=Rhodoligotrophos ferricapiens TaxID=3069264 RepID=UPI00315D8382